MLFLEEIKPVFALFIGFLLVREKTDFLRRGACFSRFGWYIITLLFVENKAETRWKTGSVQSEATTRASDARPDPFENTQSC